MQVRGVVPESAPQELILYATGRDQWGGEASTEIKVNVR